MRAAHTPNSGVGPRHLSASTESNKNFLFYTVAGTIVGLVLGAFGVDPAWSLLLGILVPATLLLAWRIAQYKRLV